MTTTFEWDLNNKLSIKSDPLFRKAHITIIGIFITIAIDCRLIIILLF
jgi:hypothetical protein